MVSPSIADVGEGDGEPEMWRRTPAGSLRTKLRWRQMLGVWHAGEEDPRGADPPPPPRRPHHIIPLLRTLVPHLLGPCGHPCMWVVSQM
eukprot:3529864-Pyramimonas_sp.AAC.1